ncbi:hypothetical protein S7335_4836 [Synechococcus sp. PCC 7335]|uniref:hypothetical protein n=1 Tax=Synechococcus sp. (strain ATCC 29403 / PCC 7335) TaxID=91464 RepID=UPI00017EBFEB|nr:hypothetical protein [Synechococcus sp. PCC 7335]EDX87129.1 hypothetical protein S7335_4836 [Synechococcus sp. PCC 7335]
MLKKPLSPVSSPSVTHYQHRLAFSTKVFGITLRLAGVILLIVQLVQAAMAIAAGEGVGLSIVAASAIALILIFVSSPSILGQAIAAFAKRSRQASFGKYLYALPFLITALLIVIKLRVGPTSDEWRYMGSEGGLSEYGTALIYLVVPLFTYRMAAAFNQQGQKVAAWLYYLLSAGFFFVGMEELSWGQKLLGFEEPQFWSKNNAQSELTVHNLNVFQNWLHLGFLIVGLIGASCWLILRLWQSKRHNPQSLNTKSLDIRYLIPDWPISSFFYPIVVFYILFDYTNFQYQVNFLHSSDEEHCEFIMALGILLFVLIQFFRQGRELDSMKLPLR